MKQCDKPAIVYRGRQIGVVRDERLGNRAKLRGAIKRQDQLIAELDGEVQKLRRVIVVQAEHLKAAVRAVNWQRVFAEISAAALLRILEKHANALYQEIEGAWTCYPTPSPRLRDVTDSGLVVF